MGALDPSPPLYSRTGVVPGLPRDLLPRLNGRCRRATRCALGPGRGTRRGTNGESRPLPAYRTCTEARECHPGTNEPESFFSPFPFLRNDIDGKGPFEWQIEGLPLARPAAHGAGTAGGSDT
ncbi:hypothetical protein NDU88_005349 [Pleurodeles waltl]|uniref:Uncharacterized protein n=1 Tax=Pleurodeles waltl TaxID=8319 RepID=A0AAV7QIK6_PLEWA|nr:hypothetical protein NDU88_005349 [Pleurodeles waltl]